MRMRMPTSQVNLVVRMLQELLLQPRGTAQGMAPAAAGLAAVVVFSPLCSAPLGRSGEGAAAAMEAGAARQLALPLQR